MAAEIDQKLADLLRERLSALCVQLGYGNRATFITPDSKARAVSHVMRQALAAMRVDAIFALHDGFQPSNLKPVVYLARAANQAELRSIRRDVWSQGVVPFLLVVMPETVEICSGFQAPTSQSISVPYHTATASLEDALATYTAERLSSSITWANFDVHRESGIDHALVEAIEALNKQSLIQFPNLKDNKEIINALIGKFIYTYVLIDRGILSASWLIDSIPHKDRAEALRFFDAIFNHPDGGRATSGWTARAALSTFDAVDDAINGCVFALSESQRAKIPDQLCHLVHRVIRCGEELVEGGAQLSFFDVSFANLRSETISAIYERFVSIEDKQGQRDNGVFYTPPHLVDHVLDRVEAVHPFTASSRVIDPAAGSGIFLVGAYRRIMECTEMDIT